MAELRANIYHEQLTFGVPRERGHARAELAHARQLRSAKQSGRAVDVELTERNTPSRIKGPVRRVAPTNTTAQIGPVVFLLSDIVSLELL
jgi:hypothetical protein